MSLFKLRSLWSSTFPEQQFDQKHLSVGKFNDKPCFALGSYKGIVRVYLGSILSQALHINQIYENNFESPIIDIKFVIHPDQAIKNAIGVLLFKKFAFLSFEKIKQQYNVKIRYVDVEPAFAISPYPLSVATLNSSIQYLNPLNLQKIKVSNPIFAFTRSMDFLYFVDGEELVLVEGTIEQWRIIVGQIKYLYAINDIIVAIGDSAVWQIVQAKIIKTKVFDEEISHGNVIVKNNTSYNLLIANFNCQLLVYTNTYSLIWAIKLDSIILKVIVCQHPLLKGALTILTESGTLEICYTGSQISEQSIQNISQEINMKQVLEDTNRLMKQLKSKKNENSNKIYEKYKSQSQGIKVKISCIVDKGNFKQFRQNINKNNKQTRCTVKIQLKPQSQNLKNVNIKLSLPSNIISNQKEVYIQNLKSFQQTSFHLYSHQEKFPYENFIYIIIRYQFTQKKQGPQVYKEKIKLPMELQCSILNWQSLQKASNKIVIESNKQLPSFNEIFPQLINKNIQQQRKSVTFQLSNSIKCSLAYNKSYNKLKIQSQFYCGLCYLFIQYIQNIKKYNNSNHKDIKLTIQIPLQQFFGIMKQHYDYRQKLKNITKKLQQKSQQFRSTQKKLLIKIKQKMSSINNIDKLLQYNYQSLINTANQYQKIYQQMNVINHNLQIAIKFVTEMLFLRSNTSQKAKNTVLGILGYQIQSLENGWEEKVMANSSYFLNKRYNPQQPINFQKLQKIPLWIIAKVNNGQWDQQK